MTTPSTKTVAIAVAVSLGLAFATATPFPSPQASIPSSPLVTVSGSATSQTHCHSLRNAAFRQCIEIVGSYDTLDGPTSGQCVAESAAYGARCVKAIKDKTLPFEYIFYYPPPPDDAPDEVQASRVVDALDPPQLPAKNNLLQLLGAAQRSTRYPIDHPTAIMGNTASSPSAPGSTDPGATPSAPHGGGAKAFPVPPHYSKVVVVPPTDRTHLPKSVLPRLVELLTKVLGAKDNVIVLTESEALKQYENAGEEVLVLTLGRNNVTEKYLKPEETEKLGSEGFAVKSAVLGQGATVVAVDGNQWVDKPHPTTKLTPRKWAHGNRGLAYGLYAALEELGFAFMHPLAPTLPPVLPRLSSTGSLDLRESPRWSQFRAIHYHTQHPLELTPFLQGWGDKGTLDEAGWEAKLPEWRLVCEWLLANRQNGFEWALLESERWEGLHGFARSDERLEKLKRIVEEGHGFGIMVGVDVPIAFAQQHSFRLLKKSFGNMKHMAEEKAEIEASLDWVMKAGFDFLGTENGTSEFTHVSPQHMIEWMNYAADHAAEKYNVPMHIKIHCSTGQVAKGFVDERTGDDINYNMLPHFASNNMGILPHTVETYALDDPAPTYGNKDFSYMREYIKWELKNGNRSVVFYPETAYWVSFDIDVPLFLPLYAERRVHDLRLLASDEDALGKRMDGQLIFSSGWEWGYWLNDVIAARAAWNPHAEAPNPRKAFEAAVAVFTRHARTPEVVAEATGLLAEWAEKQRELLILGRVEGMETPANVHRRNGHAYLEGWDTWDDVSKILGKLTQPDRMSLIEFKQGETWRSWFAKVRGKPVEPGLDYEAELVPLLKAMDETFSGLADRTEALAKKVPPHLSDLWDDLADAGRMTALRAKHVRVLYEYVYSCKKENPKEKAGVEGDVEKAREAVRILREAHKVVARREEKYRVPVSRIASWTGLNIVNPTAYPFTYLWTVHSLHLWWRDTAQALVPKFSVTRLSFCNIIDPVEVGLGDGKMLHTAEAVATVLSKVGLTKDYFAVSEKEPKYPEDIPHWKEP
ncbi:hypothetical protein HDU96_009932 [Phlyctochytrium bullatum]|nr:hypothetical protein HDU96_009932 [Phlyctochytrium bullatum]